MAVVHPTAEKPDEELVLPGTLQAYVESPIYARTNGYLLRWYKDIGSHVKKGELLADIDTPEVDQELMQARAARQQVVAQMDLAKINADRYQALRKTDSVSQQEADTQSSGYRAGAGESRCSRCQREAPGGTGRLQACLRAIRRRDHQAQRRSWRAHQLPAMPARARSCSIIARIDPLRVYVSVPQAYAPAIHDGRGSGRHACRNFPGRNLRATVARTADAIDPTTRTLLTEVDVPNKDGKLLPGSFGEVHFRPKIDAQKVTIPSNAMLFRREGPQVAVVGSDGKVQLRRISIGRDYGNTLEIVGGVDANDRIIVNPSDSIEEGQKVNVAPEQQQGPKS